MIFQGVTLQIEMNFQTHKDAVNMIMFARYDCEVEEQVGESAFGRVLGPPVIGWR